MRKIISIILVLCICLSLISTAFAADEVITHTIDKTKVTTIQAEEFSNKSGGLVHGTYLSVNLNEWFEYKINVLEDGEFLVKPIIATTSAIFDATISIDGEEQFTGKIKPTSSYSDYQPIKLGIVALTKGEHTLRFGVGLGAMHFDAITLEEYVYISEEDAPVSFKPRTGPYKNIYLPATVEAEDFDMGADGYLSLDGVNDGEKYRPDDGIDIFGNDKVGYYLEMYEKERVSYTVNVESEGIFALNVNKGAGSFNIYFDDKPTPFVLVTNGSSQQLKDYFVANIFITKGTHKVTFEATEPVTKINSFSLLKGEGVYYTLEDLENELPDLTPPEEKKVHSIYKNLYVSPNGSDDADGSKDNPFATLKRAKEEVAKINDDMTGDIVVNIAPGSYRLYETEVFTKEHSGKNGYNVIFKGENIFDAPIIHGGKKVSGWEKHDEFLWKAPLDTEGARNLYINGYPASRSKSKYKNLTTGDYVVPGSEVKRNGVTVDKKNFPHEFSNPSDMEFIANSFWVSNRFPVKDIIFRENDVAIEMDNTAYFGNKSNSSSLTHVTTGRAFYLENAMELLDEPGEFYYNRDEKTIYYYPYSKEDMTKAETYVDETEYLLRVEGDNSSDKVRNITFDNLDFRYGACYVFGKTGMWSHQADSTTPVSGAVNPPAMMPSQITVNYADNVNFVNNRLSCLGSAGIGMYESVTNSKVDGNVICDISGTAVIVGHFDHVDTVADSERCQYVDVTNNVIHRVANEYLQCAGLAVYYEKFINICHNDFKDVPYSAVTIGWGWVTTSPAGNITCNYNRIENPMVNLDDGGAIYTLGPLRQSHIAYNYIVNNQGDYGGALYTDSGSAFLKLHHNVVDNTVRLWSQGQYYTRYMEMYDTYSNTDNYSEREKDNSIGTVLRDLTVVTDGNWPKEAQEIMANAGLEPEYKNLLEKVKLPEWKIPPIYTIPDNKFISMQGSDYIQAEDFLEGGEGVGYHKIKELPNNNAYRPDGVSLMVHPQETGYVIDTNFPGEWIAYETEIKEDGVYEFELKGSHAYKASDPQPAVNVYIDGELVLEHALTAVSDNWYSIKSKVLGKFHMTKGVHHIKIEILENGFFIDAFRFNPEGLTLDLDEYGNDIDYNEGKFVTEEEFLSNGSKVETETLVSFTDLNDHWATRAVLETAKKGIVNGFPDGSFKPDEGVTLEQTILMAYRALKINPKSSALEDAKARKVYSDGDDLSKVLTREEFAEVIMKVYTVKVGQFNYSYKDDVFTDMDEITKDRLIYVLGAYGTKLMEGDIDGAFRPKDIVTRAEAATVLNRI